MSHRPPEPQPLGRCCRTRMRSPRNQSTGRTGRRGIRRDLRGGRLASHGMPHPPLKSRPTGALAPVGDRVGRRYGGRPILGRRLPQEDATNACAEMRRIADGERVDVEWRLLKPGGVVGDEDERAETYLVALSQNTAGNHDDRNRKNRNFTTKVAKTPAPRWAPTVVDLRLTVEWGVGMWWQDPSYGEVVHTSFTSSGPSRRK